MDRTSPKRTDVVATVTITSHLTGTRTMNIYREDVTGTNGALRAAHDTITDEIRDTLRALLACHREYGQVVPALTGAK